MKLALTLGIFAIIGIVVTVYAEEPPVPASFVDPERDPAYYLDRYFNEYNYKVWFDENYSEYDSIYHAVGMSPYEYYERNRNSNLEIICGTGYELMDNECVKTLETQLSEPTKDETIIILVEKNNELIAENNELKRENYEFGLLVTEMQKEIENLKAIVLEQIRVIMKHFQ